MTDIYLMRHGEAATGRNQPDAARTLTPTGYEDIRRQAGKLAEQRPAIAKILHSPYTRAEQTAIIVNERLQVGMQPFSALTPSGSTATIITVLTGEEKPVLLVTHLPLVAELALALCDRQETFYEGTVVKIERDDAFTTSGRLAWTCHV